jgi:hypothetical protein
MLNYNVLYMRSRKCWRQRREFLKLSVQHIQLFNTKYNTVSINCGVPPVSILGPLLFVMFICDITRVSNFAIPIMLINVTDDINFSLSDQLAIK